MGTKCCTKCQVEKPIFEFSPKNARCKECRREERRARYVNNRTKEIDWSSDWKRNNPERYAKQQERYVRKHGEHRQKINRKYYQANREVLLAKKKEKEKAECRDLTDQYIVKLIRARGVPLSEISKQMIESHRIKLQEKRAMKDKKAAQ